MTVRLPCARREASTERTGQTTAKCSQGAWKVAMRTAYFVDQRSSTFSPNRRQGAVLSRQTCASTRLRQSPTSLLSHPLPSAPASDRTTESFHPPVGAVLWFLFLCVGTKSPYRRTENEIRRNQTNHKQGHRAAHRCAQRGAKRNADAVPFGDWPIPSLQSPKRDAHRIAERNCYEPRGLSPLL